MIGTHCSPQRSSELVLNRAGWQSRLCVPPLTTTTSNSSPAPLPSLLQNKWQVSLFSSQIDTLTFQSHTHSDARSSLLPSIPSCLSSVSRWEQQDCITALCPKVTNTRVTLECELCDWVKMAWDFVISCAAGQGKPFPVCFSERCSDSRNFSLVPSIFTF